jgi:hypothetical protein
MALWICLVVAMCLLVASWALLVLLAARLPAGTRRGPCRPPPACATTVLRPRAYPRVPCRAKLAVGFALVWVHTPMDLIPE